MAGLLDLFGLGDPNQTGGLLAGINQGIRGGMDSPLTQLGLGLLSGNGWQEGVKNAVGLYGASEKQRKEQEAYRQLMEALAPSMAPQGGGMPQMPMQMAPQGAPQGPPMRPPGSPFTMQPGAGAPTAALPPGMAGMSDAPPVGMPRPEVPSSAKVWGDREAEAAGLYDKPGAAPPASFGDRFASAYGGPPMPQAAPQAPPAAPQMAQAQPPAPQAQPQITPLLPNNGAGRNVNRLLIPMLNPNLQEGPRKALELLVGKALDDAKLPEDQKNYGFYHVQETAAGRMPQTFGAWQLSQKHGTKPIEVDAGTHTVLIDPVTRQQVGQVSKNIAAKATEEKAGAARGQAQADLPNSLATSEMALQNIQQIREHPGKQSRFALGAGGVVPALPGTDQAGFVTLVDQLKGKTFLQAYETLKGGGQITEVEGKKATEALARLNRIQSPKDFDTALSDMESVIKAGMARARQKAVAQGDGAGAAPGQAVRVNSPDEARRLPPGTLFMAPDGRMFTR